MGCSKSSTRRKIYGNISLPQETRKISNKQLNLIFKGTRKEQMKPRVGRWKDITKIRELNEENLKRKDQ